MKDAGALDDVQLWKRFLDGDRKAFSDLFRKYYKALLNYGFKLIPQEDLVKDSIQELFFLIWERRDRLSEVEYVRSYLYSSLRRTVFRQAEIQKTRNRRDFSYSIHEQADTEVMHHEHVMIVEEIVLERRAQLKEALKRLSTRQREAIFLKFYSGLSCAEIAEVMGMTRQSVYNKLKSIADRADSPVPKASAGS